MYKIIDLHNDYFTTKKFEKSKQNYLHKCDNLGITVGTAIWTTEMDAETALKTIEKAKKFTESNANTFLAIEDLHFLSKQTLYEVINIKPKYCGLTWNFNNNLAGGAKDTGDLTSFGKLVVQNLENADVFVDTAHLNEKSFMSFASITTKPILCSHTATYTINAHQRNLKDYQIKMIVESGGIVGISLVSEFLNGRKNCTINDYVAHIDYLVNKFGIDNFAIGTDFYGTKHLPFGVYDYETFRVSVVNNLLGLGYKPNDINKLFYKNVYDFFDK